MNKHILCLLSISLIYSISAPCQQSLPLVSQKENWKFDLGSPKTSSNNILITPDQSYTAKQGYGLGKADSVEAVSYEGEEADTDFLTSASPFYFMLDMEEGNYEITVTLGDMKGVSSTWVKAESRRLMLKAVETSYGQQVRKKFMVNIRTPNIDQEKQISIKDREKPYFNWDNLMTIEFGGERPAVAALEIKRVKDPIVIYLAGNSTVVDQEYEPWAAWGQMFPYFLKENISVANFAESGRTLRSFKGERRLEKIMSLIKEGDFLFIEFAHNDMKKGAGTPAQTTYKKLIKDYVAQARAKGAKPVLITSMHRRKFDADGRVVNTLEDYPQAMRDVAKEVQAPLIDLNEMSKVLYETWGPVESTKAFVHYPAGTFVGQKENLKDNTHFSTYGAFEIASCIVQNIKTSHPDMAALIKDEIPYYNPAEPNPFKEWLWPVSPRNQYQKPLGN